MNGKLLEYRVTPFSVYFWAKHSYNTALKSRPISQWKLLYKKLLLITACRIDIYIYKHDESVTLFCFCTVYTDNGLVNLPSKKANVVLNLACGNLIFYINRPNDVLL